VGRNPGFNLTTWDLSVDGAVEQPLTLLHGAPLRLLVSKRYSWKCAKFLRRLEVMSGDRMGFWELNGYHNDADPWREQPPLVLRS
jgi:DMSO/TMAO reductase YedYZ molybdopterin-dependent catalytic subunit